ncbi:hypothetical protein BD311DRAFT_678605, partial [Dichomitus squalens]
MDKDITFVIKPPKDTSFRGSAPSQPSPPRPTARTEMTCYGCGEVGHGMYVCPQLNDLIVKGVLKRDSDNRYVMSDGSRIPRVPNETLVKAVQRLRPAQSNYVALAAIETADDYYTSDAEDDHNYSFPAEHAPKRNKEARRERFEGVFPPPRSALPKRPAEEKVKAPEVRPVVPIPHPKPVETHGPTFNPLVDDDIIMEDIPRKA